MDHFGLNKVKQLLIEYLAVVRLWALTVQEAEMEQTEVQEVMLNVAAQEGNRDPPQVTGRRRKSREPPSRCSDAHSITNVRRSTRGLQSGQNHQSPDFAVRMRNSFDIYYSSHMKLTGSSDHWEQGRHRLGSQLSVRLAGRVRESPSVALAMKLRFGANGGLMLPVDLVYTGAAQSWILFSSCECLACLRGTPQSSDTSLL